MPDSYTVRLDKECLVFSAAHFITFNGDVCERLHGHNYRVFAELTAPLDDNRYVVDFIALRDTLQFLIDKLDHHVILPQSHPSIRVERVDQEIIARFNDRRWVFPVDDCVLLPVENTTAEQIARYLGGQLLEQLRQRLGWQPDRLRLGVDENHGQWGICEIDTHR